MPPAYPGRDAFASPGARASTVSEPAPRRTKIVCTIGPATAAPTWWSGSRGRGWTRPGLNFSHGDHASHLASIQGVRRAQELIGRPLAVMADLQGPKLRIAANVEPRTVIAGDTLVFASGDGAGPGEVGVTFDGLADVAAPGQEILIADGAVRTRVTDVRGAQVETRVEVGGLVTAGKGMNLPGIQLPIPSMTEKDAADLAFALEHGVDYVVSLLADASEWRHTYVHGHGHCVATDRLSDACVVVPNVRWKPNWPR